MLGLVVRVGRGRGSGWVRARVRVRFISSYSKRRVQVTKKEGGRLTPFPLGFCMRLDKKKVRLG